jgi:sugar lactone lactonase YvrE
MATGVAWTPDDGGWIVTTAKAPGRSLESEIWYVDPRGSSKQLWQSEFQLAAGPVLSPDGRRLAVTIGTRSTSIWKLEGY